ncbi:MAG: small ribosomal subunit Rsm22 family protein [Thermodesulfovibrio sp.]|nr:small ribosomal subunit Rsm22 family protein [Thermodesulfovibrio sp.]
MKNQDFLKGYIAYFVPVNLAKTYSLLKELFKYPSIFQKKDIKIVDIGCGPSPAILAVFKLIREGITSINYIRYIGVELEEKAIQFGREMIEKFKPEKLSLNYEFLNTDASDIKTYVDLKEIKPDILIFSNSLGEIFDARGIRHEDFLKFIKLFTYNNDNFSLIILEPATKKSASRLHALRDILIKEMGFYPYSPCVNSLPCPALKANNWCYEERKWIPPKYLSFLSSIGLQVNYLKFSYFILRRDGLNIGDTFSADSMIVKNTSHLLKEKGKSRLWGCWNGKLIDIERLKRDYNKEDEWLKIKKGCYFSFNHFIELSEKKIRIPRSGSVRVFYCPEIVSFNCLSE